MEELIHYVWKHKLLPLRTLKTTDGKTVEVIDPGLHNHGDGPDFFNAKVKINGQLWIGNVEIHTRASDWYRHKHDKDQAYNNVVLHVVGTDDKVVFYSNNPTFPIPQVELEIPNYVRDNYDILSKNDCFPKCADMVGSFPRLTIHSWLAALQVERLEERSQNITQRWESMGRNWEETYFATIARNLGFGTNGDAFERWARSFPLIAMAKHRDSLFQVEAMFFGQAGMLEEEHDEYGDYYQSLRNEYLFLKHKFSLKGVSSSIWKHMRLRPDNFPEIKLAQIAMLYHQGKIHLSQLLMASSSKDIYQIFTTGVSDFWKTHYTFKSQATKASDKRLSKTSIDLIIINSVVPLLFAYGRYKGDESLCDHAFELMEELKAENNKYIRQWTQAGIRCESAADSQAIIQLSKNYCEKHNCLRCRFGYEFIKHNPTFLAEEHD